MWRLLIVRCSVSLHACTMFVRGSMWFWMMLILMERSGRSVVILLTRYRERESQRHRRTWETEMHTGWTNQRMTNKKWMGQWLEVVVTRLGGELIKPEIFKNAEIIFAGTIWCSLHLNNILLLLFSHLKCPDFSVKFVILWFLLYLVVFTSKNGNW